MSDEHWLPIPGADGYEVSDLGQVRSRRSRNGRPIPHVLKLVLSGRGRYPSVRIKFGETWESVTVHRLVMLAFVGPLPAGKQTRHLDGDNQNNALSNLAYGTPSENMQDCVRHGTHHETRKTHCRHGHPFDDENTFVRHRPDGRVGRECLACRKQKTATRAAARREGVAA